MTEQIFKDNAPDESFAALVAEAIEVYSTKGPAGNSIPSPWHTRLLSQFDELWGLGDGGFKVATELSFNEKARVRRAAATHFEWCRESRGQENLLRLMHDDNAKVRVRALQAYGTRLFGRMAGNHFWKVETVPEGIERIIPMLTDPVTKVRWYAVHALGRCAGLGNVRVDGALREALKDPKHKIVHAVAGHLSISCPGCGAPPQSHGETTD